MIPAIGAHEARVPVALQLALSHGRFGSSARVEMHDRPLAPPGRRRVARIAVRGWIDAVAVRRLIAMLEDLGTRGVDLVLLDCAQVRHIDFRQVPRLVDAGGRFEARAAGLVVCGLSPYLQDLLRLAGCDSRLRCWPSAADLLGTQEAREPSRECAS